MLADDRVDVLHLATPNHLHYPQAKAAVEAAKNAVCDLAQFLTGRRVVELLADLATTIPVRQRPTGEVESFAADDRADRVDAPMSTEDVAHALVRFDAAPAARSSSRTAPVHRVRPDAAAARAVGPRSGDVDLGTLSSHSRSRAWHRKPRKMRRSGRQRHCFVTLRYAFRFGAWHRSSRHLT
jgi:predicted dehydrogenase